MRLLERYLKTMSSGPISTTVLLPFLPDPFLPNLLALWPPSPSQDAATPVEATIWRHSKFPGWLRYYHVCLKAEHVAACSLMFLSPGNVARRPLFTSTKESGHCDP
jgi:hypothetical protein